MIESGSMYDKRLKKKRAMQKKGMLSGGQAKLDKNKNNKLDAQDFKILRAEKAKGRGMGLQDEKLKPGKVMKAKRGKFLRSDPTKPISSVKPLGKLGGAGSMKLKKAHQFLGKMSDSKLKEMVKKGKNPDLKDIKGSSRMSSMEAKSVLDKRARPRYSSMAEMRKAKGFLPGESAEDFNKRRMKLAGAKQALRATRIGKIALGVAAAAMAGKEYLKSKSKKKEKKMGGGMMQKPMGYDIGGGVSKAKEHKKILKDKVGTALGYMGEMTKNIGRATPILAAQEVANLIKNKRSMFMKKSEKQQEESEKRRIPKDFYPKFLKNRKMQKKLEIQEYRPKAERKEYKDLLFLIKLATS